MDPPYFAPTPRGVEDLLAAELEREALGPVVARPGGVAFGVSLEHAYRACLYARTASRVLARIAALDARDVEAFYDGVRAVRWEDHLDARRTLAVTVVGKTEALGASHFLALKAKDAIVDRLRDRTGARPSVDTRDPDVRVHVHVDGLGVSVAIDLAGKGLHRRGRARRGAEAPIKESLAAAVLYASGFTPETGDRPLFDPMCGSGTLLLEAADIARDVAPGLRRGRFGAERWAGHDAELWGRLCAEARDRQARGRRRPLRLFGADAAEAAVRDARRALVERDLRDVRVELRALADAEPPTAEAGLVVTNPPYGARLGDARALVPLYETLGDVLKRRFPGWTAFVLCGEPRLAKRIGLRTASRRALWNGPIECRLLEIPVAGAASGGDGPAWRRTGEDEAAPFAKKLRRNARERGRRAERLGLTAYRVYDADIPEFNLSVDRYGDHVRVEEYAAPKKVPLDVAEARREAAVRAVPGVLGVEPSKVSVRVRRRRGPDEQYERLERRGASFEVREGDLVFVVNLTDYLDTGLFLDDRGLRERLRARSSGRDVLNLFAYTCTATVAAAKGGARSTTSVDLSKTYLEWGRENLERNGLGGDPRHRLVRDEAKRFLESGAARGAAFDVAFVAPPSLSRSRAMRGAFDVERDHVELLLAVSRVLRPGGGIVFSTHRRGFSIDAPALRAGGLSVEDIGDAVTPFDFVTRRRLSAWELHVAAAPGGGRSSRRGGATG